MLSVSIINCLFKEESSLGWYILVLIHTFLSKPPMMC